MKEIIALQQYTDKFISLYEGEVRNIQDSLADRLIEQDIVAEHSDAVLEKEIKELEEKVEELEESIAGGGDSTVTVLTENSEVIGYDVSVVIPEGITNIRNGAFANYPSLTSIIIPSSVTSIGDYAFQNCRKLTNVTIPEGVVSISFGAFSGCTSLTSVTIPSSVTNIGTKAFNGINSTINCGFAEGAVAGAPWGATSGTIINYNVTN